MTNRIDIEIAVIDTLITWVDSVICSFLSEDIHERYNFLVRNHAYKKCQYTQFRCEMDISNFCVEDITLLLSNFTLTSMLMDEFFNDVKIIRNQVGLCKTHVIYPIYIEPVPDCDEHYKKVNTLYLITPLIHRNVKKVRYLLFYPGIT